MPRWAAPAHLPSTPPYTEEEEEPISSSAHTHTHYTVSVPETWVPQVMVARAAHFIALHWFIYNLHVPTMVQYFLL
jgi:hypothetical protein